MEELTESQEQERLFEWAGLMSKRYPVLQLLYHIPNEGKRSPASGGRLKRMGLKRGVPDICLPVSRGGYHGLYIELKCEHSGKATEEQLQWLKALDEQGYAAALCHGWWNASRVIEKYIKMKTGMSE